MQSSTHSNPSSSLLPRAIGLGIVGFYILFTLLPNSNSLMVKWPWVFIWQFGLMLGPVMLISQLWRQAFRRLGSWLDWLAIAWILLLTLSAAFAQFQNQALWYSWAALCGVSFLYVIHSWLTSTEKIHKLLIFQGILSIVFSAYSLTAWLIQTVRPYLKTLDQLSNYGIDRSFDLQILTLRNWHPIGHQNYVAGYLLLTIPLLGGLALSTRSARRFWWIGGCAISSVTLYSTASRGSWFGLLSGIIVFLLLTAWHYPQLRKKLIGISAASCLCFLLWGVSNPRIRELFASLLNREGNNEISYRTVTNATGWFMGLAHPLFGAGLGNVPLLYQKYRPAWAGQKAELTYQLHSTPAQLWAELGLFGILLSFLSCISIICLCIRWSKCKTALPAQSEASASSSFPIIGILSGISGYSVYAITDYQLDNISISGTLLIYMAVLIANTRKVSQLVETAVVDEVRLVSPALSKKIAFASSSLLVAIALWLYPIHRAWMFSSQGFIALQQNDTSSFVTKLEQSNKLAPWEPYYPYQLAWNLGELAFQSTDAAQQEALRQESVSWFEKAIALSPYREFGYSNLGWLLVNTAPEKATVAFFQSTKLTPEKRGAYFALGYSLLKEGKLDLATKAMVIELMRQPILLTSPIWQSAELSSLYPNVTAALESTLLSNLSSQDVDSADSRIQQMLGMLYWWQGDHTRAEEILSKLPTALNRSFIALTPTSHQVFDQSSYEDIDNSNAAIAAWTKSPNSDAALLQDALSRNPNAIYIEDAYYAALLSDIKLSITDASNFHQWLTQRAPTRRSRNQRLGFGTISRHIDGPLPKDFSVNLENIIMTKFLSAALPATMPHRDVVVLVKAFADDVLARS